MLWHTLLCCFLAVAAVTGIPPEGSDHRPYGWLPEGGRRVYEVEGRTLTSLYQFANFYTGVLIKAELHLHRPQRYEIRGQVKEAKYAEVNKQLTGDWNDDIQNVTWQNLPLSESSFEVHLSVANGEVERLLVDANLQLWEVNMIKGMLSQLQIVSFRHFTPVYRIQESFITGRCQSVYQFTHAPNRSPNQWPKDIPVNDDTMAVLKFQNISYCRDYHHMFHLKFSGFEKLQHQLNHGGFVSNSVVSRLRVDNINRNFTVISSNTVHKVLLSPNIVDEKQAMTVSFVNVTYVRNHQENILPVAEPRDVGNLVYMQNMYDRHHRGVHDRFSSDSSSGSSSSSRSNSIEQNDRLVFEERSGQMRQKHVPIRKRLVPIPIARTTTPRSLFQRHQRSLSNQDSSSSSSSSQIHDQSQNHENSRMPRFISEENDMFPISQSFKDIPKPKEEVIKLARKIGSDVQNSQNILSHDVGSTFITMVRIIRNLPRSALVQIAQELKTKKPSTFDSDPKWDTWNVFLDGVAVAGTHDSTNAILDFFNFKMTDADQASRQFRVLPNVVQDHDKQYIEDFFNIVKDSEVKKEPHLNETVVLAFSQIYRFIHSRLRHSPVNHREHHISPKFIRYLFGEYENSYNMKNSTKMQIYAEALGRTGDIRILQYIEPYLLGQMKLTPFQRLHLFRTLDYVAGAHPHSLTRFFLKFLVDQNENPDIRVQAVFHIMKSNPSAAVLRVMAELTHVEQVKQVIAAIQSAIQTAAKLKGTRYSDLAYKARSAVNMLNKNNMDLSYSKDYLYSNEDKDNNHDFEILTQLIGSLDSIFHKTAIYNVLNYNGGARSDYLNGYMVSSVTDVIDDIKLLFKNYTDNGWSKQQMKDYVMKYVEGNIQYKFKGNQRFRSFDLNYIESIPSVLQGYAQKYKQPYKIHYTNTRNSLTVIYGHPTVMGLPGQYSLYTPKLWKFDGSFEMKTVPDLTMDTHYLPGIVNAKLKINAKLYAGYLSQLSVIAPFNDKRYTAAMNRSILVDLPLEVQFNSQFNINNDKNEHYSVEVIPTILNKDANYMPFQWANVPYTTIHKIKNTKPDYEDNDYHVNVPDHIQKNEYHYGKTVGEVINIQYETANDNEDYDLTNKNWWIAKFYTPGFAFLFRDMTYGKLAVNFDAANSKNHDIRFKMVYEPRNQDPNPPPEIQDQPSRKHRNRKVRSVKNKFDRLENFKDRVPNPATPNDDKPDSEERRVQYLNEASSRAGAATSRVLDLTLEFLGKYKASYAFTVGHGTSLVDGNSTYLFFYNFETPNADDKKQVCITADFIKPQVPLTNFAEALSNDPDSTTKFIVNAGEKGKQCKDSPQAFVDGTLTRTGNYKEFIMNWPLAKECSNDMRLRHVNILRACQNVTYLAENLKRYEFDVKYDQDFPVFMKKPLYLGYSWLRYEYRQHVWEDPFQIYRDNKMNVVVNLNNLSTVADMYIKSDLGEFNFTNVPLARWLGDVVTSNPRTSPARRFYNYEFPLYNMPTCAIDVNGISTFDNATTYVTFENTNYKVMEVIDDTVTVKKIKVSMTVQEQNKKVDVVTEKFTLSLSPNHENPEVHFNSQRIPYSQNAVTKLTFRDQTVGYVHGVRRNAVMVELIEHEMTFVYENQRFLLLASNKYRNKTRGLCGNMDGEIITDTLTPNNCYAINIQDFIASYAEQNTKNKLNSKTCIQLPVFQNNNNMNLMKPSSLTSHLSNEISESLSSSSSSSSKSSSSSENHDQHNSHSKSSNSNSHSSQSSSESSSSSGSSSENRHQAARGTKHRHYKHHKAVSSENKHSHSHSVSGSHEHSSSHSLDNKNMHQSSSSSSSSDSRSKVHNRSTGRNKASQIQSSSSSSESNESKLPTHNSHLSNTVRPNTLHKQNMANVTKVMRREKDVCFSIRPIPTCLNNNHAANTKVLLQQFLCLPQSPASEHYLKMIKKGVNPDLSHKKNLVQLEVKIPLQCVNN